MSLPHSAPAGGGEPSSCTPAFTWVQDRLDDVPVPPLGLHTLQLLGLVPLPALLLLLLPGVLRGGAEGQAGSSDPDLLPLALPGQAWLSFPGSRLSLSGLQLCNGNHLSLS